MQKTVSVTEVTRHFSEYINRVAYRGEYFVLLRGGKPVAELRPVPQGRRLGELPALLRSLPHLSPEEAEDLARELAEARAGLATLHVRDPWAS